MDAITLDGKELASFRVVDLKMHLESRGLPKSGSKKDLIERLSVESADEEDDESSREETSREEAEASEGGEAAAAAVVRPGEEIVSEEIVEEDAEEKGDAEEQEEQRPPIVAAAAPAAGAAAAVAVAVPVEAEPEKDEDEDDEAGTDEITLEVAKTDHVDDDEDVAVKETGITPANDKDVQHEEKAEEGEVDEAEAAEPAAEEIAYEPQSKFRKLSTTRSRQPSGDRGADGQPQQRKRQWGARIRAPSTEVNVSSQSLKDIVPNIKPLLETSADIPEEEDDEVEEGETREAVAANGNGGGDHDNEDDDEPPKKKKARTGSAGDAEGSSVISVRNLVRPFTVNQLKELLKRTGKFEESDFWIDRIKSHAIVHLSSHDEAFETLQALDDVRWPSSNPKTLKVELISEAEAERQRRRAASDGGGIFDRADLSLDRRTVVKAADRPAAADPPTAAEEKIRARNEDEVAARAAARKARHEELAKKEAVRERESASAEADKPEEKKTSAGLDDLFRKTKAQPCIYWAPKVAVGE